MTQQKTEPSLINEEEIEEVDDGNIPRLNTSSGISTSPDKLLTHAGSALFFIMKKPTTRESEKSSNVNVFQENGKNLAMSPIESVCIPQKATNIMENKNSAIIPPEDCNDVQEIKMLSSSLNKQEIEDDGPSDDNLDTQNEPGKFVFQLLPLHCLKGKGGRKIYKCDVCGGIYRHAFSLKRHYLRSHLNYDYLSEADLSNCSITQQHNGSKKGTPSILESKKTQPNLTKLPPNTLPPERVINNHTAKDRNRKVCTVAMPGLYRCHTCGKLFNELKELKHHVTNHPDQPNNRRYSCPQCDMTFSHRQNLVRHLSVHSGEKPYACRYCDKRFPTATNQKRHERIHEGVKPYVCSHCSSVFTQSGDLKKHIRKQHGQHFHPCAFCVKYFSSEKGLTDHIVVHGECIESNAKVCGKRNSSLPSFRSVSLPATRRIKVDKARSSSTPSNHKYICSTCKKRFRTFLSLSRHRRSAHSKSTRGSSVHVKSTPSAGRKPSTSLSATVTSHSPKYNDDIILRDPPSTEVEFYADIAYNISDNLLNHLDGKLYVVQQPTPPTEDDLQTTFGDRDSVRKNLNTQLSWSRYNFPPDYQCDQDNRDTAWYSDASCSKTDCEAYDLSKPRCCRSPEESTYVEHVVLSHSEMMHSLSLSPVASEYSGEILCIDGVLDLSMPHKSSGPGSHSSATPRSFTELELPKIFVCVACGESYPTLDDMENHKINNHPNVCCTHIELEGIKDMPLDLFKQHCSPVGMLKNCSVPPASMSSGQLVCTKCQWIFRSVPELHSHMLDCGGHKEIVRSSTKRQTNGLQEKKRNVQRGMKRKLEDTPFKRSPLLVSPTQKKPKKGFVLTSKSYLDRTGCDQNVFKCDGCERRFNYLSGLERHKKGCPQKLALSKKSCESTRDIRQQHSCPSCCRSFTYLASLKKHILDCGPRIETKLNRIKNITIVAKRSKVGIQGKFSNKNEFKKSSFVSKVKIPLVSPSEVAVETTVSPISEQQEQDVMNLDSSDCETDDLRATESTNSVDDSAKLECHNEGLMLLGKVCEGQASLECVDTPKEIKEEKEEGDEDDEKRGLICHSCPHCFRTYTYLANFKKHVNEACPLRKDLLKINGEEEKPKSAAELSVTIDGIQNKTSETLPPVNDAFVETLNKGDEFKELATKKLDKNNDNVLAALASALVDEVEGAADDSLPFDQAKLLDEPVVDQSKCETSPFGDSSPIDQAKPINDDVTDRKKLAKLQPYCCPTCHRVFLSYVKLLQHQLSHKLNIGSDDVCDDGDKKFQCQTCRATFSIITELNQHLATCNWKTKTVSPNVPVEASVTITPSSMATALKNKGGWPKGKSRKGYIAKNKRNTNDVDDKCAVTVDMHTSMDDLPSVEVSDCSFSRDTILHSSTKRVSPKTGTGNGKKPKMESSKKENDHHLLMKKLNDEIVDEEIESSTSADVIPTALASHPTVSRFPLETQGNITPNPRAKRLGKPKPKKWPSACPLSPLLPSSSTMTNLEIVGTAANS